MIEDESLNRCVKAALEAEGAFAFRPRRTGRVGHYWRWTLSALVAASVALVLALRVTVSSEPDPVADAIQLLSEADGLETGVNASSAEMLLAWQDAPCLEGR